MSRRIQKLRKGFARSGNPDTITVVSGLPRSGTSLMMQMLEAGGMGIVTDQLRKADEDNPRGYYELDRVKHLDHRVSWLDECQGKAVKVISMLLSRLPTNRSYRIVFMERAITEVLASQKRMLERSGRTDDRVSDERIAAGFERHLSNVKASLSVWEHAEVLYVSHNQVIQSPRQVATQVCQFLGRDLNVERMVNVVDTRLYRHRRETLRT